METPERNNKEIVNIRLTVQNIIYIIIFLTGGGVVGFTNVLHPNMPTEQTVLAATDTLVYALEKSIESAQIERLETRFRVDRLERELYRLNEKVRQADSTNRSGIGALEKLSIGILNRLNGEN